MPTLVTSDRGTGTLNTESRRVRDVTPSLIQLEPDAGPLTTILSKLKKKPTVDPKIEWFEDELLPRFDELNSSLSAAATTMEVKNFSYFRAGDIVRVNKGELIRVTTTPTSSTVTITRAEGTTAAAAAAANDQLHILSNSNAEGAARRELLSTQRSPQFNYCQIIRDPFGWTNTALETTTFAGQDEAEEQAKQLIEHKKHIEYMLLLGERGENTSGTQPRRISRGIIPWVATNIKVAASLTEPEFEDFLRVCFRYGSSEKLLLCSPKVIQVINAFARGKLETRSDDSTYGITLTTYHNAGRRVMLAEHKLMTNSSLSDFSGVAGQAICVDIGDFMLRHMRGRITTLKQNIQANDIDGRIDEYLSEVGLEAHQERKHGLLKGVLG